MSPHIAQGVRYHVAPASAAAAIARDGLRPAIGPRSVAAGERRPFVYAFRDRSDVDQALCNWLGELFEDTEEDLVLVVFDATGLTCESEAYEDRFHRWVGRHRILTIETL